MNVEITNLQDVLDIPEDAVRRIVETVLADRPGSYSLVFVDDNRMTEINRTHLGREGTTDVMAFPLEETPQTDEECAGEIIVSAELARDEAESRDIDPQLELALYVTHGALHLAGLDDQAPDDAARMHTREKEVLTELGYDVEGLWHPLESEKKTAEP